MKGFIPIVCLSLVAFHGVLAAAFAQGAGQSHTARHPEPLRVDNPPTQDASTAAVSGSDASGVCNGRVSVQGQAQINKPTDEAHVSMTVEVERKTAREAREAAAIITSKVHAAILEVEGVERKHLTTNFINVHPKFISVKEGRDTWRQVIDGYVFQNSFTARVVGVDVAEGTQLLGHVVDGVVAAGGDDLRVDSISFSLSQAVRDAAMVEVRKMAASNAAAKAKAYASELGVGVSRPLVISEWQPSANEGSPDMDMMRGGAGMAKMAMAAEMDNAMPIAGGGETTVQSHVYVVFQLCEEANN